MISAARLTLHRASNLHVQCRQLSHLSQNLHGGFLAPKSHVEFQPQKRQLSYFEQYLQFIRDTVQTLSDSKLTSYLSEMVCEVHDSTGLPWWSVIVLTGFGMRLCLALPAQIISQRVVGRRRLFEIEMSEETIPALKSYLARQGQRGNWTFEYSKKQFMNLSQQARAETIAKYNCGLAKIYLPQYLQIPVWLSMTLAFRNLIYSDRGIQMMTEGPLFLRDMTLPVETMALPIFIGLTYWLSLEVSLNSREISGAVEIPKALKFFRYFLRSTILIMVYFSTQIESGVCLYWASSGAMALSTNLILLSPRFKKLCHIARFPDDPKHPYQNIYKNTSNNVKSIIDLLKPK